MTRKFLQSLGIESDLIDKIMDANGSDIEREKAAADALREEIKSLKLDVSDAKKELKEARDSASADEESYKAKYEAELEAHKQTKADAKKALDDEKAAHTATKTTYETEKLTAAKSAAVLKQLIADGANEKFAKVVAKAFDLDSIELDGDAIKDWESVSAPHKAEFADVFQTADVKGVDTATPPKGAETDADPFIAGFDS